MYFSLNRGELGDALAQLRERRRPQPLRARPTNRVLFNELAHPLPQRLVLCVGEFCNGRPRGGREIHRRESKRRIAASKDGVAATGAVEGGACRVR